MNKIYIISGPAGVGKSTTAKSLAEQFVQSAYIEGDSINHMVVGGYLPPWKSEESLALVWENIADLSINFVKANKNVIIDYVAFPEEVEKLSQRIIAEVQNVEIRYVIL
ncbi:AAA family ATPase [Psychrobacillus sp. NPDC093180]|uniref:AAA family ATPase n=1 Tax=Psychrobacillus sp. NPDC093180 TaxID=3364489 RepID=UPI00380B0524